MSTTRRGSARALYLELASLGIDVRTGRVPPLDLECGEIAALMRRVRENRQGLRWVVSGEREDLEAIRGEAA